MKNSNIALESLSPRELMAEVKNHGGSLTPHGDEIRVKAPAPLPNDLMTKLREHKQSLLLLLHAERVLSNKALMQWIGPACAGLSITPAQFISIINTEDKHAILAGEFEPKTLRAYAKSFSEGIESGRILFHPSTGALMRHGIK